MLPCEDVGRHHQRALFVCSANRHHGEQGDDRLSAAHVALQQCVELLFAVEPVNNRIECRFLPRGQLEWQTCLGRHHVSQVNLPFVSANLLVLASLYHAKAER